LCISFLQEAAQDPAKVDILARLDYVFFGGGPLDKEVGDQLAAKGVKLLSVYGA
jgi:long-subunit acyl-CoA synthetase (AMP-forming)